MKTNDDPLQQDTSAETLSNETFDDSMLRETGITPIPEEEELTPIEDVSRLDPQDLKSEILSFYDEEEEEQGGDLVTPTIEETKRSSATMSAPVEPLEDITRGTSTSTANKAPEQETGPTTQEGAGEEKTPEVAPEQEVEDPHERDAHTYFSDLARATRGHEASTIRTLIDREERRKEARKEYAKTRSRTRLLGLASFIVIGLGVAAITYVQLTLTPWEVTTSEVAGSFIRAENATGIDLDNREAQGVYSAITSAYATERASGTITDIGFAKTVLGSERVRADFRDVALATNMGIDGVLRSVTQGHFMLGTFTIDGTNHPFLLLPTSNPELARTGLDTWEEGSMADDLASLFGFPSELRVPTLTTTPFEETYIKNIPMRTLTIDTRVNEQIETLQGVERIPGFSGIQEETATLIVASDEPKMVLAYGFIRPNLILFIEDARILSEIIERLGETNI